MRSSCRPLATATPRSEWFTRHSGTSLPSSEARQPGNHASATTTNAGAAASTRSASSSGSSVSHAIVAVADPG